MMRENMSYRGHFRAILVLGLPLIGGNLAQFAITLTDTLMLGWYDVEILAGQVLAGMLLFELFLFGSGAAIAVMPLVAEAEAAGDEVQVRRVTRMGLWVSMAFACLFLPVFWYAGPILLALGQEPKVVAHAVEYLRIAGFGVVFALLGMVLKSYLSALERTGIVLWGTVVAAIINAVANYALIFGHWGAPELGIKGAAIASLASQAALFVALLGYVIWGLGQKSLFARLWRADWSALWLVIRLGLPIGFTNLAEVSLFAASALMMGWLGAIPLAAHGIALQLASATFMVHLALSNAATVRAGRAVGRRDPVGLKRGGQVVVALSMGFGLLPVALFLIWPAWLIGLFLDPGDPHRAEVLSIGVVLLAAAALFQMVDAAQVMALGLLRGVKDTQVPMIMAVVAYWVIGMPASYVLGFVLGMEGVGVWLGLVIGLAVAAVLLMARFWMRAMPAAVQQDR